MELTIDKFGRMVLPKSIRDDLGLEAGDKLEASEQDGAIVLHPAREQAALQDKDGVLVFVGAPVGDIELAACTHTLAAHAARKCSADKLLALNEADFRRVWADAGDRVSAP